MRQFLVALVGVVTNIHPAPDQSSEGREKKVGERRRTVSDGRAGMSRDAQVIVGVVFHAHVDHREGAEEAREQEHPGGDEHVHVPGHRSVSGRRRWPLRGCEGGDERLTARRQHLLAISPLLPRSVLIYLRVRVTLYHPSVSTYGVERIGQMRRGRRTYRSL